ALALQFDNKAQDLCPNISFMQIEIEQVPSKYEPYLEAYFTDLGINKNNFFTDISNYLAYESGQPTHCFDQSTIRGHFALEKKELKTKFKTLLGTEIELTNENLVFTLDNDPISLAGVMGGASTACSSNTTKVLVECAYFQPQEILGKARKYNLSSDAAYKFERGVDYLCQEGVLRRFLQIVSDHTKVKSVSLYGEQSKTALAEVPYDSEKLNAVVGINFTEKEQLGYLSALGFQSGKNMTVPAHRSDVDQLNDLAEEVTRMIGYDNIPSQVLALPVMAKKQKRSFEELVGNYLVNQGCFEVINNPFTDFEGKDAIPVDNPLDKQRAMLRTCLMNSIRTNIAYNQNRQKDSIKFFEFSDIYKTSGSERHLALAISGRVNKNAAEFNAQLDYAYLKGLVNSICSDILKVQPTYELTNKRGYDFYESLSLNGIKLGGLGKISKDTINSKVKTPVFACELATDNLAVPDNQLTPTSDFPASYRDLSFSLSDLDKVETLTKLVNDATNGNDLLTESFIFDFFQNKKLNILKLGFRFKFQAEDKSLTDEEIDQIMDKLITDSQAFDGIFIEGL
ncbi:MAG: phenylalanine--tRNA ligase subunit beta, partial [Proteobacteria bacterium]|nr:phenylalanine--tRNA ligase subunit beta [Pseudomonadota bacterium]